MINLLFPQNSYLYYIIKLRLFILFISICLIILLANLSYAMGSKSRPDGKGLYIYSGNEISNFLKNIGYPDFSITSSRNFRRNSDGTALRLIDSFNKRGIVAMCDGSINELVVHGSGTWFNDDHKPVLSFDKDRVYYIKGQSEKRSFSLDDGADPSGHYFIKTPIHSHDIPLNVSCITEIYSIEKPDLPLAKLSVCGIQKIFLKDNKVILFGNDYISQENKIKDSTTAHIFQIKDEKLIEIEKVNIDSPEKSPAPFYVMDISPWNDEVLFIDVYDFPSRSRLYVFNLKTHEMKKIGKVPFSGGWGVYLQCDIIQEVTKKLKKSK